MNTRQAKKLEQIRRFRYIDDTFFSVALDKFKPGVELILQIVTENPDLRVKTVHTQETVVNLYGKSVRFDIFAADKENRYNCEIQREDRGASPKRARCNSAIMDSREISEGVDSSKMPGNIVIFICENDIFGRGLPLYHIRRKIEETNETFDDGALIIYVNGSYRGDDPIGRLMHDFFCDSPKDMHYLVLAERMQFVKNNEKGVTKMCRIMEEYVKEEAAIIAKRAEKRGEKRG
ncbi:MAG: hypothetical protein J6N99_02230, partial [Schwartzia sp.]|nr:hypothetical protein [Schwartzia sp. (in: firmicutes)]